MSSDTWSPSPAPVTDAKPARPRWRRRLLIIFAAIAVLTASITIAAALGIRHGVQNEHNYWSPRYKRAITQVAGWKSDAQTWEQTSDLWHSQLQDLQKKIRGSVGSLHKPRFVLWNSCSNAGPAAGCPLQPNHWYAEGVPDTFTYVVSFRATVPVDVAILSLKDYVCWNAGTCAWHPIAGWTNRTRLNNGMFHGAEGCGGYLVMFYSRRAGTFYPEVSAIRNPAVQPTGVCR